MSFKAFYKYVPEYSDWKVKIIEENLKDMSLVQTITILHCEVTKIFDAITYTN